MPLAVILTGGSGGFCSGGLVGGGSAFENYMLDGSYALNELLDPSEAIQLVGYQTEAQSVTAPHA